MNYARSPQRNVITLNKVCLTYAVILTEWVNYCIVIRVSTLEVIKNFFPDFGVTCNVYYFVFIILYCIILHVDYNWNRRNTTLAIREDWNVSGRSKNPCEHFRGERSTAMISLNRLQWAHAVLRTSRMNRERGHSTVNTQTRPFVVRRIPL